LHQIGFHIGCVNISLWITMVWRRGVGLKFAITKNQLDMCKQTLVFMFPLSQYKEMGKVLNKLWHLMFLFVVIPTKKERGLTSSYCPCSTLFLDKKWRQRVYVQCLRSKSQTNIQIRLGSNRSTFWQQFPQPMQL